MRYTENTLYNLPVIAPSLSTPRKAAPTAALHERRLQFLLCNTAEQNEKCYTLKR